MFDTGEFFHTPKTSIGTGENDTDGTRRVSPRPQLTSTSAGKASAFVLHGRTTARQVRRRVSRALARQGGGQNTGQHGWIVGEGGRKGNAVFAARLERRD
jgi:hypothetical protein